MGKKGFVGEYGTTIFIIVLSAILQLLYDNGLESIAYKRDVFLSHFYYQLISPNFVHANWMHYFLNILNLIALSIIFKNEYSNKSLTILFVFLSIFSISMLYIVSPNIISYVGMSGVLYGVAIYLSLKAILNKRELLIAIFVLVYVMMKLFFDDAVNKIMGVDVLLGDLTVIKEIHVYGAIGGVLYLACEYCYSAYRRLVDAQKQ